MSAGVGARTLDFGPLLECEYGTVCIFEMQDLLSEISTLVFALGFRSCGLGLS